MPEKDSNKELKNLNNKNENVVSPEAVEARSMVEDDKEERPPNDEDRTEAKKKNPGMDLTDENDKEDASGRIPPE